MILLTYTVPNPRTMMVHPQYAFFTLITMVASRRFYQLTFEAVAGFSEELNLLSTLLNELYCGLMPCLFLSLFNSASMAACFFRFSSSASEYCYF